MSIVLCPLSAHPPGGDPEKPQCPGIWLGFHFIGVSDSVVGHVVELNVQPLPLPGSQLIPHGSEPQPSNPTAGLSGWPVPILSHLTSINSGVAERPPMNNKDTPITQEIPRISRLSPRKQEQRPSKFFIIQQSLTTLVYQYKTLRTSLPEKADIIWIFP